MLAGVRPLPFSWDRRPHTVHRNRGGPGGKGSGEEQRSEGGMETHPPRACNLWGQVKTETLPPACSKSRSRVLLYQQRAEVFISQDKPVL